MRKNLFSTDKVKIAYLSNHFSGAIKLNYLLNEGFKVDYIVTISEKQAESNKISGYFDFTQIAHMNKINLHIVEKFNLRSKADIGFFNKNKFDLLLISGWQRLVPSEILNTLKIGAIGEHGSSEYLPRGRGRSPINWTIIQGRERFVMHIFLASTGADEGKIIDKENIIVNIFDDIYTVYTKAALASARLFLKRYREIITNTWQGLKEAKIKPTYLEKKNYRDDFLDWMQPTRELYNKVRAITHPYPGAKSKVSNKLLLIWKVQPFDFELDDFDKKFGQVLKVFPDNSFVVKTIDGSLLIREYDYNGRIKEGDILE